MAALLLLMLAAFTATSCGGDGGDAPPDMGTPEPTTSPTATPTLAPSAAPTSTPEPTTSPTPTPESTPIPTGTAEALEPIGFPLDPGTVLGAVRGEPGSREIAWGAGPTALEYSRDDQPSGDPVAANGSGWNCRVHVEYETVPAADWYIPAGTPIVATMEGTATLYAITTSNAFDYYDMNREPYIGDPDRANAAVAPFPGPGGGKGIYVVVENGLFATEYGHLAIGPTLDAVPDDAYVDGFGPGSDFTAMFGEMRDYLDATPIASWPVAAGEVIGYSGDSGYSEAPHLHYVIRRAGGATLCPTGEAGFEDGGWLLRDR